MDDDIVTRLLEEIDSLKVDVQVLRDAIVEIERLRAAGDALAEMVAVRLPLEGDWPDYVIPYLRAWKEARRG